MDRVSIVEAKRDLSRLVNEAAFGHKAVVVTSRGRPKAVLISHEDFLKLTKGSAPRIVRLGGLWKGTPPVSERELRKLRSEMWGRLGSR